MIRAGQYLSRETMIERLVDAYHTGLFQKSPDYAEKKARAYEAELKGKGGLMKKKSKVKKKKQPQPSYSENDKYYARQEIEREYKKYMRGG